MRGYASYQKKADKVVIKAIIVSKSLAAYPVWVFKTFTHMLITASGILHVTPPVEISNSDI